MSVPGAEEYFAKRRQSPIQKLVEDIKSWQATAGVQRFPNRADAASEEERRLASRCANLLDPHIRAQLTPGKLAWFVQLAKDTMAWRDRVGRETILTPELATTGRERSACLSWQWLQQSDDEVASMARDGHWTRVYDLNEQIFGPHVSTLLLLGDGCSKAATLILEAWPKKPPFPDI